MEETQKEEIGVFSAMSTASIVYGIILIIISMLIFTNTKETYTMMISLMGIYLVVKGLIDFIAVFSSKNQHRMMTLFVSALSFLAGFIALSQPLFATYVTVTTVVYIIGIGFIVSGFMAFKESMWIALINIAIGLLMFFFTKEFAAGFAWFIAFLLLISGVFTIILGASAKNVVRELKG